MSAHGRQPFYHRNTDVDEIGYQVCGERTLMSECGTIELRPGQFSAIPVSVAHDNYGREDIHLILYVPGPALACVEPVATGAYLIPPFPGWEPKPMVEVATACLGGMHCDLAYSMADEELILKAATRFEDKMEVLEPKGAPGEIEWIYKAPRVWIGHTALETTSERVYRRRMGAHEIQYQAEGTRTLVTQRGVATLEPGDFVSIPLGCAFASMTAGGSRHLSVLACDEVPPVREPSRIADTDVHGFLAAQARTMESAL